MAPWVQRNRLTSNTRGLKYGYRSGLEERVGQQIASMGLPVLFETVKIKFEQPPKNRTYTPDFILPNGVHIETKGRLTVEDRQKHLWIKAQLPDLDLRFVFSNPNNRIAKGSNTSYADWCNKNGFLFSRGSIPREWFR